MSEHPEQLLPWYANDTLEPQERELVERHLAQCADCRAELALLRSIRREVKTLDAQQPPGELARARLLREARKTRTARRPWVPAALAASVAIIAVQAVMLTWLWRADDRYAPLGAAPSNQVTVQVRFDPQATEREMRDALAAVNGTIVDGPGALGVYRVRLDRLTPAEQERVRAAIDALRAAAAVDYVEREP